MMLLQSEEVVVYRFASMKFERLFVRVMLEFSTFHSPPISKQFLQQWIKENSFCTSTRL